GPEWGVLITTWSSFEEVVGYGQRQQGKGNLNCKLRPAEWGAWILKTKLGLRPYESKPVIRASDEFGMAVSTWWFDLQPAVRRGEGNILLPIYTSDPPAPDMWAELRRGGPNGIVTFLTILAWW
ncbi:hypothetical protein BDN72DRAFT_739947, partial [Pluteus cervinus]